MQCGVAGSFTPVDLDELETASHFVKYAVAAYAIIPVTENPDKRSAPGVSAFLALVGLVPSVFVLCVPNVSEACQHPVVYA